MPNIAPTTEDLRSLYLDLIKRSLTGALAEDNDSILGGVRTDGSPSMIRAIEVLHPKLSPVDSASVDSASPSPSSTLKALQPTGAGSR